MAVPHNIPTAAAKATPPPVASGKKVRKVIATHTGNVSVYKFVDGSGSASADFSKFPDAVKLFLGQGGLTRYLAGGDPTIADVQKRISSLMAGVMTQRAGAGPKLPDPLVEALVNMAKSQGQGTMTADQFATMTNPATWNKFFQFDQEEPTATALAKRGEWRAKNDVQAAIRLIKLNRVKSRIAAGKAVKAEQAPVDFKTLAL